jgi:hypothetical protein
LQIAWVPKSLILVPIEEIKKILKLIDSRLICLALKSWSFCIEMIGVLKKNPKNKICSQMYEVFDLNEAYVV